MLTAEKLEIMIELEDKLKGQYQTQLDAKSTEIEQLTKKQEEQKTSIQKQLAQIAALSADASPNKRTEQLNRELNSRCEKMEQEVTAQKKRLKGLQKDLGEARAEIKVLKQYDALAMKKNLDAGKKKLVEKTSANDLLQKSYNKSKTENAELQRKVKELEAKLAELEPVEEAEESEEAEAVAA